MSPESHSKTTFAGSPAFTMTHWSVVIQAGHGEGTHAAQALEKLCRIYWYPLYAYARRSGHERDAARDLTQGFFAHILGNQFVAGADETKGKFRSYLIKSFTRFMRDEYDRSHANKRGGGAEHVPIDHDEAETRYGREPADESDPEKIFERRWAVTLIEQTLRRLEAEFNHAGKANAFAAMNPFLTGENRDEALTYADLGRRLDMSEESARVAVHRLRVRYRELLRDEVAQTVETKAEVDQELQHLRQVLSS